MNTNTSLGRELNLDPGRRFSGTAPRFPAVLLRFSGVALGTSLVNLLAHVVGYALFLKGFFEAHPAGPPEFMRQLVRPPGELVVGAMVITSLTMGLFITTVMYWARVTTFREGVWKGALLGALFWTSVNSGLYASNHLFSLPSVLADTPLSALSMAIAAAFCAWLLLRTRLTNSG